MNRINKQGIELISYSKELANDYPELVRKAMLLALEQMVQSDVLDLDTYNIVLDPSVQGKELEEYLLTKKNFRKTEEEIFVEFENIRNNLNTILEEKGLHLTTESIAEKDMYLITKKFCINEEFALDYFAVEEKDLIKLMNRRGFVEKFAVLRLTAIFKALIHELKFSDEQLNFDVSLVYFDKDENGYSIDAYFEMPLAVAEDEEKLKNACDVIANVMEKTTAYYEERMVL